MAKKQTDPDAASSAQAEGDVPGTVKVLAPAHLVGSGIEGQTIGKDRIVRVTGPQAEALCRSHGFERVKG